jgi:hypothetical protein
MRVFAYHPQECVIAIWGFHPRVVGQLLQYAVVVVHRRFGLICLQEEVVEDLESGTGPGSVIRGWKPARTQELFLRRSSPVAAFAVASVHRDFVQTVRVEHNEMGVEWCGLQTTLARRVAELDA